jgi:hypothetical protein
VRELGERIRPGHPEWPIAWTTYQRVRSLEEDIADLKEHGVGLISCNARSVDEAKNLLSVARRTGMKYHISIPDITDRSNIVRDYDLEPYPAILIGGAFRGRAIDRHVFSFEPEYHEIIVEPPVYNPGFAYTEGSGGTGRPLDTERIAHYLPDIGEPSSCEVVVPLRPFDGEQHLEIIRGKISRAPPGSEPEVDTVRSDMRDSKEVIDRGLHKVSFDLGGMDGAMLDSVGLALHWRYDGTEKYWVFGHGNVSAWAESTREALREVVRRELAVWIEANDGGFPHDVVLALRFGDECFYITGHVRAPCVSYPLWDYSEASIDQFRGRAGSIEHPRTWGFPEIYGEDAYSWWQYLLHESCAELCGIVRDEIQHLAAGLLLFRNQTRMGVFALNNDHDGSGQELLSRNLDVVHLDPYPVRASGYGEDIPRDMSYCAGLARRYDKILIPWMQGHIYGGPGGLQHVSPEDVKRMGIEQHIHGVDAIIWLGYGFSFPEIRPDSWEMAAQFHRELVNSPPPKPVSKLAVVRTYNKWATSSLCDGKVRNPADWMLQQMLHVWSVDEKLPYDVFEVPPGITPEEKGTLEESISNYEFVVSNDEWEGAWNLGCGIGWGSLEDPSVADEIRRNMRRELQRRGWLSELGL